MHPHETSIDYDLASLRFLRPIARLGSLISAGMLLLFLFGGQEPFRFLSPNELLGFCFFPFGILLGLATSWKYELAGGILTILSLVAFYLWHFATAGDLPAGPYFALFAAPGVLFILSAICLRTPRSSD